MKSRRTRRALLAAALLLALAAPLLAAAAEAPEEAEVVPEEDAWAEDMPGEVGELDLLADGDLDLPDPTPEPTAVPTPKPNKKPWLTSYNYPKDKINFENEIWAILTRKWGLADYQAAGLMSSIQAESSFCPYNAQGRGGSDDRGEYVYDVGDSVGFGLCQWTSSGRKAALLRHAVAHGSGDLVWDFDIQMGYMGSEIDMAALKSTRSLYEAAEWAVLAYERPDQRHANSWPGTRYERGREIFRRHTGRDYDEPERRFSATWGGGDALGAGEVAVRYGEETTLSVRSNYYWRLEQVDATKKGWLEVRCPSLYRPDQTENCVCGYACDGEKPLTLTVKRLPPVGQTYRATLRFEIYRGGHEIETVPVAVTCTAADALSTLDRYDPALLGQALALALAAGQGGVR